MKARWFRFDTVDSLYGDNGHLLSSHGSPKVCESRADIEGKSCVNPSPAYSRQTRRTDLGALFLLLATIIFSARDLLFDPVRAGLDTLTFFWPSYSFLSDQLKSGNIPGWNPYQFSGVPFLADPESGWWYLPAMLIFGALPLGVAIKIYATVHLLIAGLGTYAYGRVIGMLPAGALIAAWAVSQGGLFTDRSRCCYAHIQLAAWIPIALLGIELAIRAAKARQRVAAWFLCACAISQMLAGWIGQGAMYGLLLTGAYVAFRTLLQPQDPHRPWRERILDAATHGLIPGVVGIGLSAPGTLPRLLYYQQTSLANGYTGSASWAAQLGGWTIGEQVEQLINPSGWYLGTTVLVLASVAMFATWRSGYTRLFAALTLTTFVLGLERHTVLHHLLFTIVPGFEKLHTHIPERIALVLVFGPAVLAGLAFTELQRKFDARALFAVVMAAGTAATGLWAADLDLDAEIWIAVGLAIVLLGLLAGAAVLRTDVAYRLACIALTLLVIAELQLLAAASLSKGTYLRVDATTITERNETAHAIQDSEDVAPPRYFGYDPALSFEQHGETTYYRHNFDDGMTIDLLVNNHGMLWQIADIQGYNPLQLQRYVEFMSALNGGPQEYHGAYILPDGLASPLLPLLSPAYIVIPKSVPAGRVDLQLLVASYPEVASTSSVRILRYTDAMPRAWIVHEAISAESEDIPELLASGAVDLRTTAVLETEAPPLDPPGSQVMESAKITRYEPSAITVDVTSDGRGLLVLSETYAEGWSAQVDGQQVDVLPVDGLLRGVPIPAGSHVVTLKFDPPGLDQGFAIFGATVLLIAVAFGQAVRIDKGTNRLPATSDVPLD